MTTNSEAPVSISTTAYYKGFSMIITKRDPDVKHERLLEEQINMIDWLVSHGFKPSWNEETNKQVLGLGTKQALDVQQDEVQQHPEEETNINTNTHCAIHNKDMKERWNKDHSVRWYDHRWQVDGEWMQCNGKKVKS